MLLESPLPSPGELGWACPHHLGEKGSDQRPKVVCPAQRNRCREKMGWCTIWGFFLVGRLNAFCQKTAGKVWTAGESRGQPLTPAKALAPPRGVGAARSSPAKSWRRAGQLGGIRPAQTPVSGVWATGHKTGQRRLAASSFSAAHPLPSLRFI